MGLKGQKDLSETVIYLPWFTGNSQMLYILVSRTTDGTGVAFQYLVSGSEDIVYGYLVGLAIMI